MTATIAFRPATQSPSHNTAKVAGFAYVGAWVIGLTAFGVGPASNASTADIARYFADHRTMSTLQSLLIHGVAAFSLLVVLSVLQRTGRLTRVARAAGLTAVGLSFVQCVLDVYRSLFSTGSTTAALVHTIDRIDGLKMLALAVMISASIRLFRATAMIGPKMSVTSVAAAVTLVVSGTAYAGHVTMLLASAELSLLLLLFWVGYTGVAASRSAR